MVKKDTQPNDAANRTSANELARGHGHPRKRLAAALAPEASCFGIAPRVAAAAAHARPGRDPLAVAVSLGLMAGSLLFSPALAAQTFPTSVDMTQADQFDDAVSLSLVGEGAGEYGSSSSQFGRSIASAGDINGDGIGDFIVGARIFTYTGPDAARKGAAYVVFGQAGGFDPASLTGEALRNGDGSLGFVIQGTGSFSDDIPSAQMGASVAPAGDFNGDGLDDVIVAALETQNPNAPAGISDSRGAAYIIFGSEDGFPALITPNTDLDGNNGVMIVPRVFNGETPGLWAVSGVGDINGDGLDEVLLGTFKADPGADYSYQGAAYVVFGNDTPPALIDLQNEDPAVALTILGDPTARYFGRRVAGLGDINGDGVPDFGVISEYADDYAGRAYVLFGQAAGWDAPITVSDNLDPSLGFAIAGEASDNYLGRGGLSPAGDINSDGIDDFMVGASSNGSDYEGAAYVLFGQETWNVPLIEVGALPAADGLKFVGESYSYSGRSHGALGDFNGDGVDDIVIGARGNGYDAYGHAYVVFGGGDTFDGTTASLGLGDVGTTVPGIVFSNDGGSGPFSWDVAGIDDVNGDGRPDLAIGNFSVYDSDLSASRGRAYVIFGGTTGFGEAPQADVDVTQLDFGTVSAQPGAKPVTVTNNGTAPLTFGTLSIAGDQAASFTLVNDQCSGQTLAVDATCTFSIQVTGADPGVQAAEVRLPSNAGDGVQTVPLSVQREQAPAQPVPALGSGLLALLAGLLGFLGLRRFPVSRSR